MQPSVLAAPPLCWKCFKVPPSAGLRCTASWNGRRAPAKLAHDLGRPLALSTPKSSTPPPHPQVKGSFKLGEAAMKAAKKPAAAKKVRGSRNQGSAGQRSTHARVAAARSVACRPRAATPRPRAAGRMRSSGTACWVLQRAACGN